MVNEPQARLRRRAIREEDLAGVIDLLRRGFPNRPRSFWERGLRRMGERPPVEDCPRTGFLLDDGRRPVGVALTLFGRDDEAGIRCNLSSWTVDAAYRAQAPLLIASVLKRPDVTFTNLSAAPHTWPTIEAQGFRAYSDHQSLVLPLLGRTGERARVSTERALWSGLPEAGLLDDHAGYGCSCLVLEGDDAPRPLVLSPVRARAGRYPLSLMQLIYCRDVADLARFAGAVGRWMARRGMVGLLVDGDLPAGLPGWQGIRRRRRYVRGPRPPRLGDLAYTELALFGP